MVSEINFMVGGEAGQGVQTVGFVLAKTMARAGLFVFADQDYESRVRGGHNFFRVRVSDSEVGALAEKVDVLIALNQETVELHQSEGDSKSPSPGLSFRMNHQDESHRGLRRGSTESPRSELSRTERYIR